MNPHGISSEDNDTEWSADGDLDNYHDEVLMLDDSDEATDEQHDDLGSLVKAAYIPPSIGNLAMRESSELQPLQGIDESSELGQLFNGRRPVRDLLSYSFRQSSSMIWRQLNEIEKGNKRAKNTVRLLKAGMVMGYAAQLGLDSETSEDHFWTSLRQGASGGVQIQEKSLYQRKVTIGKRDTGTLVGTCEQGEDKSNATRLNGDIIFAVLVVTVSQLKYSAHVVGPLWYTLATDNDQGVQRLAERVVVDCQQQPEHIWLPLHQRKHWVLMLVDLKQPRSVKIFDSLRSTR